MNFKIKINTLLIAILLMEMTFMLAVNTASAHTPNDTYWNNQWGPANIYAPQAWDIQKGSTDVIIAILDTGIDYNHEDLAGRVIQGWNFVNDSSAVMDDNNHGTHVAGIAGAIMDNSTGIAGMARSRLLAVKVCNFMGLCSWPSITDGIYYAANNSAKVISMSIKKSDYDSAAERAVNYAYNTKGALLVSCSGEDYIGNGTEFIMYPGNFSNVIAVGATDSSNQLAYFSNYGAKLELVAPGDNIYSTIRNNGYDYDSGCSMSVPHVSGVAALVWSQYPALIKDEVRWTLTGTADDLGSPGRDIYYGYGKVNAYRAVSYLPGWSSRKQKNITGTTAGAQTNYQMKLTVYNSTGTDTPGVVYLGGNVQDDFGDLRFTKSDGVMLLDYWIESYTSGVNATVWVEVDSIPASPGTTSIYLYYGYPFAPSASSGAATFRFFDDFNDLNNWITDISPNYGESLSASASGSEATITTSVSNSYPSGSYAIKRTGTTFSPNVAIRTRYRDNTAYWYPGGFGFGVYPPYQTTNNVHKGIYTHGQIDGMSGKNGTLAYTGGYAYDNTYYVWDLIWTSSKTQLLRNGASLWSNTNTAAIPTVSLNLGMGDMGQYGGGSSSTGLKGDWILVRNCVNPEPQWA